jgi:hypothetical protein
MKKKVKMRKRTGRSRRSVLSFALLSGAGLLLAEKKKKTPDLYAIVGGTVFRDPGFALRGAEVTLEPEQAVVNGSKLKPQKAISDARGEFAFRVPPLEGAKYKLTATAPGMKPETKQAETRGGEERIDVTFNLLPASK